VGSKIGWLKISGAPGVQGNQLKALAWFIKAGFLAA